MWAWTHRYWYHERWTEYSKMTPVLSLFRQWSRLLHTSVYSNLFPNLWAALLVPCFQLFLNPASCTASVLPFGSVSVKNKQPSLRPLKQEVAENPVQAHREKPEYDLDGAWKKAMRIIVKHYGARLCNLCQDFSFNFNMSSSCFSFVTHMLYCSSCLHIIAIQQSRSVA